ncbi:pilus assembly PilX family protein [Ramlibacter albus]|uniref:Pilus assembly PilX N-terminal domain-containing protein n=1 Tax=Ramlibacter albus TaxID=2079448 RepID=A0A923S565_9BURK|nr:pilus assembly PilX N-terminal domain-containing protein [Ramlibacter albus]MBC5768245.1 pilus assembly PilX N-terminal domain-containing protein [Ramlibacter albus]
MVTRRATGRQQGAALIIALIVITLVSLVVVGAFNLSSSNLKGVANTQFRSEGISAANLSIEQVVSGSFLGILGSTRTVEFDLDANGTADYKAKVYVPQCPLRVRRLRTDAPSGYETSDGVPILAGEYTADYELRSVVSSTEGDTSGTGVSVTVREGVRVPMSETDYQTYVNTTTCTTGANPITLITSGV